MKKTASISISAIVLDATRKWAEAENRPLSRHIEGILASAVASAAVRRMSAAVATRRTSAATESAARRTTPRKGRAA